MTVILRAVKQCCGEWQDGEAGTVKEAPTLHVWCPCMPKMSCPCHILNDSHSTLEPWAATQG